MAFIILLTSIFCVVCGEILLKVTVTRLEGVDFVSTSLLSHLGKLLRAPSFFLAIAAYFSGMVLYLAAISKLDVSLAYPIMSLNFAIILVYSKIFFRENVTPLRWFGVFIILFGVFLISRS
ncbi:MAG: EamA family transporter [bacterium]